MFATFVGLQNILSFAERRGSSASHGDEIAKENACLRFLIGPFNMVVSSSALQRVMKMVTCALDHDYESYLNYPEGEVLLLIIKNKTIDLVSNFGYV